MACPVAPPSRWPTHLSETYADNFESGWISVLFYSHEPNEPPYVHIDKDAATAKVWLHDATVAAVLVFLLKI